MKKWKKMLAGLLALALMLAGLPMYGMEAQAAGSGDFIYDVNEDGNSVAIALYTGSGGAVTIPSEIDGKSVTEIKDYAFLYCDSLVSVSIPASVKSIGEGAFYHCTGMEEIRIPEGLTSIGEGAFQDCSSLSAITVEEGNAKYESRDCNAIIETESSTLILGCKNTVIPDDVTCIGNYAFSGCSGMTEINVPASVTSIGKRAFEGCSSLTGISIPADMTSIEQYAFDGCSSLTEITIPAKMTKIEGGIFAGCRNLAAITVEEGNAKYDSRDNCNAIIDKKSNTLLLGCKNTVIPNDVTSIGDYAFVESGVTQINIPSGVTEIGEGAFWGCSSLTEIHIPESVNYINDWDVFVDCSSLSVITIDTDNQVYDSRDNCNAIIETESNTLLWGFKDTVIPDTVTSIAGWAFDGCTGLTGISIPGSVESIGTCAFENCSGMTEVSISSGVASIGDHAFLECSSLETVNIPDSVTSIGDGAFGYCSSLSAITVDADNGVYESRDNCNAIIETESDTLLLGCKNTVIPNDVTSIGNYAFWGCSGMTEISIPGSVKSIGDYAFSGCSGMTEISIPEGMASIGNYVFFNCSSLTEVSIPDSVTNIGESAFSGCSGLTEINIPEGVTSIGNYAFLGCSSLTEVSIPNGVTSIGNSAFSGCSGMTEISIPGSVESIGDKAFLGCGLTEISIPGSVTKIGDGAFGYSVFGLEGIEGLEDLGWLEGKEGLEVKIPGFVIYGGNGSEAETYADERGFTFEAVSENHIRRAHVALSQTVYTYNGQAKTPSVTVKLDGNTLVLNTDYTVSYSSNTNVGQAKAEITGIGNYTGTVEKTYTISRAVITAESVTLSPSSYTYDGTAKSPAVTVTLEGRTLAAGTDYTVSYSSNTDVGQAKATVTGTGNYAGKVEKPYTISKAVITAESVTLSPSGYTYDGTAKSPTVTVMLGGKTLVLNTDYTVAYSNNTNAGTAAVTVTGKGSYAGTVEKPYTISKAVITAESVTLSPSGYTYDGTAKSPTVTVMLGGRTLEADTDYAVSYSNNTNAGTAAVTVTGKGNYSGTVEKTYTIGKADISAANVALSPNSYTYDGKAKTPSVTVTLGGKTLVRDTDYTVSYSNNTNAGTASATVTGKGNYTGSKKADFTIVKATENPGENQGQNTDSSITCKKTVHKVAYGAKPFKIDATSKSKLIFTSSSPRIAAVDKNTGTVTIKGTGTATITVKAGNKSVNVTVKVSPKKASLKTVKPVKGKKLTVKWAKDKNASGYQVQISTAKNFKKNMKQKNVKKTSYTFKKLKAGKKYYVRVRSYKKAGKETLYGAWSSKKQSGKVKK